MKRKKSRLRYGKIKGPGFKPQDIRCPCCFGTGEDAAWDTERRRKIGCLGCNGSGLRTDFAARLLADTIQLNEHGRPFEPFESKNYKGKWMFTMDENTPIPDLQ